ncbi:unnamed protein product [Spirodela intermedia]|uniref:Uncharacterized protein n=1 Tax=Spirodela intermedia TaxID=51605 RepID=A0A7I8KZP4_SPIIN|nr:unnamed protein product [Spirodela intermedia]
MEMTRTVAGKGKQPCFALSLSLSLTHASLLHKIGCGFLRLL